MEQLLAGLAHLPPWQIACAATWLLLQACILPSLPEEVVITTLGMLWSQGRIGFLLALGAVLVGLLPANLAGVLIGRRAASGLSRFRPVGRALASRAAQDALGALRRHGDGLVVATRFTPLVRGPVYLACGASGMRPWRFFRADALAALVQVPLLLWLGARAGASAGSIVEAFQRTGLLALGLLAGAAAIHAVLGARRRAAVASARLEPDA
jgi:membrane protein DedA with SNARE-associated domain